ncbi:MAG: saccharopine dehydrogenase NADP-binding domain-containing protein [Candidatus Krumholzibacteriota bacterium]|nr:saccharopine dehydrogenase NADP-binding domain-containing protein [Candidatus Krumholzibacteriota bacterium]
MRVLVLGAGLQGSAAAYDLARSQGVADVLVADRDDSLLAAAVRLAGPACRSRRVDLAAAAALPPLLADADACFSALPYFMNEPVAAACAGAGVHYVDLGGNTEITRRILALDAEARASGASLVPDCGLAPGLAQTVVMAAIEDFATVDAVRIRVGGLPQAPRPPLDYALFFSIHGLINEYMGEAVVLRGGRVATVPTLTEVEAIRFPEPVGDCEAFTTLGGTSTLPWSLAGRARELDYKTVRYPGHAAKIRLLKDLGFLDETPVDLAGARVSPRDLTGRLLERVLAEDGVRDLVVFRVEAEGTLDGRRRRRRFEMIDRYDEATGLSAMRRGTAFPASVVLQMLARGEGAGPGAHPLETAVPARPCLAALAERGLVLTEILADL